MIYHIILCYAMLYYIVLYYIILYYIILYYIILYYAILYYVILCYNILRGGPPVGSAAKGRPSEQTRLQLMVALPLALARSFGRAYFMYFCNFCYLPPRSIPPTTSAEHRNQRRGAHL